MVDPIRQDAPVKTASFLGKKILVVDDNQLVCKLISNVLFKYLNIGVIAAKGSGQAIATALTGHYDGIIISFALGGASSGKIIHTIRTMLPALPILVMCDHPTDEIASVLKKYGITRMLKKPFKMTSLIEEVKIMFEAEKSKLAQDRLLTLEE